MVIDSLIFGRPKRRRELALGPHSDFSVHPLLLRRTDGVDLQGWVAAPRTRQRLDKVLIYFGGRKEDTAWAPYMASYLDGWIIYTFNYRGFGDSTGASTEGNAKTDAQAIHDFVRRKHPSAEIELSIMGRSLGTGIAMWLAHQVEPAKLVLVSPFCSIQSVLQARKWLSPLSLLARNRFMNAKLAPGISARTFLVLAETDKEITHADSLKLAKRFANPPTVVKIDGTNHKTVPRSRGAQRALADFLLNSDA
jgi:alpha/beta superfamily hydrolase